MADPLTKAFTQLQLDHHLEANDLGGMRFTPQESGNRYYLTVDSTQAAAVLDRFLEILPKEPAR